MRSAKRLPQFVNEFDRDRREIIDEVERVLDLVRDASGELTERGELLRLHQAVLRGAQILQRGSQFARARPHVFKQPRVLDRHHRLVGKRLQQIDGGLWKFAWRLAPDHQRTDDMVGTKQRDDQDAPIPLT